MATRFYLTNSTTPYTPPTIRGAWDSTTGNIIKYLGPAAGGTATTRGQAETSTATNFDVLLGRWVSDGAVTAGNLSGVMSWAIGVLESSTNANDFFHVHAYVTQGDSDTPRGTLLTDDIGATEWPNPTATGRSELDQAISTVAVQVGDRIVVEIGYRGVNTSATSFTGTMNYGGTNVVDLQAGNTNVTTAPGWVQFSDPNQCYRTLSPNEKNLTVNPSAGSGIGSHWSSSANVNGTTVGFVGTGFSRTTGLRYTVTSTANSSLITPKSPASVGETWSVYCEVSCSASRSMTVFFNFTDANGTFLSPNPSTAVTLGAWQSVAFTSQVAPANTAFVWISVEGNLTAGDICEFSCVRFDQAASISAYKDGDSSGWAWDGTAEVSTSHSLGAQTVSPSGIASAEAFGTAQLNLNITATGIASAEAFGSATVTTGAVTVSPSGIASAEAFGTLQVNQNITLTGIASAEAFGTATVTIGPVTITPTGITSAEAFGTPVITTGAVTVSPSGIASAEAFGSAQLNLNVTLAGGIASGEAVGTPTLTVGAVTISPSGIASGEAFGTATLNLNITAAGGIASGEQFGTPSLGFTIYPVGIPSAEAFGNTTVFPPSQTIFPVGIASAEAFGVAIVTKPPRWRLVSPFVDEHIDPKRRGLTFSRRTGLTVFGDDDGLTAKESPRTGELEGKKYIFYGGYEYIIDDPAIVALWVTSGFEVVLL